MSALPAFLCRNAKAFSVMLGDGDDYWRILFCIHVVMLQMESQSKNILTRLIRTQFLSPAVIAVKSFSVLHYHVPWLCAVLFRTSVFANSTCRAHPTKTHLQLHSR